VNSVILVTKYIMDRVTILPLWQGGTLSLNMRSWWIERIASKYDAKHLPVHSQKEKSRKVRDTCMMRVKPCNLRTQNQLYLLAHVPANGIIEACNIIAYGMDQYSNHL